MPGHPVKEGDQSGHPHLEVANFHAIITYIRTILNEFAAIKPPGKNQNPLLLFLCWSNVHLIQLTFEYLGSTVRLSTPFYGARRLFFPTFSRLSLELSSGSRQTRDAPDIVVLQTLEGWPTNRPTPPSVSTSGSSRFGPAVLSIFLKDLAFWQNMNGGINILADNRPLPSSLIAEPACPSLVPAFIKSVKR